MSVLAPRGIVLVANQRSEALCENLVRSIRQQNCQLPIALIPFGGAPAQTPYLQRQTTPWPLERFPAEAHALVARLGEVLTACPEGFVRRFLALYGPFDEFLYADNDIVALCDWTTLFDHLAHYVLVHADQEYTTAGRYSFAQPDALAAHFPDPWAVAVTAGHFLLRRTPHLADDLRRAADWMEAHPGIAKPHDQALLHLAILLGQWPTLNLCQAPHQWLSSWAGDYQNPLDLMSLLQQGRRISHVHFSGGKPDLADPLGALLTLGLSESQRHVQTWRALSGKLLRLEQWQRLRRRLQRQVRRLRSGFVVAPGPIART